MVIFIHIFLFIKNREIAVDSIATETTLTVVRKVTTTTRFLEVAAIKNLNSFVRYRKLQGTTQKDAKPKSMSFSKNRHTFLEL